MNARKVFECKTCTVSKSTKSSRPTATSLPNLFLCIQASCSRIPYVQLRVYSVLIGNKFGLGWVDERIMRLKLGKQLGSVFQEKLLVSTAKWRLSYTTSYQTNVHLVVVWLDTTGSITPLTRNFQASNGCLTRFLRRNHLSFRRITTSGRDFPSAPKAYTPT